ncbi:MAG TPA: protein kinase [Thermoanaerobaculia bacterium]
MAGSEEPLKDERIGPYRLVKILGRGGMGEVFLAQDDRLKRQVAIKRIRRDHGLDSSLRQRLLREARAVAGLSHPAIVQIYDLIEDAAGDCIVLEYVQGRTLTASLAGGPLDPPLAIRLAREIADGLAAAHAAGIVHRDLKAENVIVTPSGHAKILDFGLAQMRTRATDDILLTQHGVLLGTFHMMSPEQANGGETDERSDLFSLGILLYEMLTGRSPFRGGHPLEILKRVTSEHPPRPDALRPDVPPRLGDLVERLLAKAPGDRPQSAAEVVRELDVIAGRAPDPSSEETVSDLPTGFLATAQAPTQALPRAAGTPESTMGMSVLRRRGMRTAALAVLAVAILATLGVLIGRPFQAGQRPAAAAAMAPLRVVVPRPEVSGGDEKLRLAASGVLTASLSALGSLQGIVPVDPSQLLGSPRSAMEMARVAAADEVLIATLETAGNLGRITLRRIHGADGQVLWSDTFDAPLAAQDLYLLADAVGIHLRRGFSAFRPRPGTLALDVRNEDFADFLEIKQRIDSGQTPPQPELERLETIVGRSPHFLQARLLAADVALNLFYSKKEISYRNRALTLVRESRKLAPEDPRPLMSQFRIELAGGEGRVAAATLAQLENLLPGDPQLLALRASLADHEGRSEEAIADMRSLTGQVPSWLYLAQLADLEARNGHTEEARHHLETVLASSPGNIWALEQLARIELLFGDLKRAEQIFLDLIARAPQRVYFTNLGAIRIFLEQYEDAIAAFRQALSFDPDHVSATLNMADAELALGRGVEAEAHYRKALKQLERNRPPGGLSPDDSMSQAQCLAHLGQNREAVEIMREALRQGPDNPYLLQSAALVYALVGNQASALANVRKAREKGLQPRWFSLPGFAALKDNPEFRRLVRKDL